MQGVNFREVKLCELDNTEIKIIAMPFPGCIFYAMPKLWECVKMEPLVIQ